MENRSQHFSTKLLAWYQQQNRVLSWRSENPDPYHVWVSEIMLQQTTFATAENRFTLFIDRFPTVQALAEATQADVLQHWAGLGYYARARNLHKTAQIITEEHQGMFPRHIDDLKALPGIGGYTAAAIAAIAFDMPSVAVDSNVKRIFARIHRYTQPVADNNKQLQNFFLQSQAKNSPRQHLQAWMDFGETLCTARNPQCSHCPMNDLCLGRDIAAQLPVKPKKKPRKQLHCFGYILTNNRDEIWLRRRADTGLLAGMLEVPTSDWLENIPKDNIDLSIKPWQKTNIIIQHRFTHIDLHVTIQTAKISDDLQLRNFGIDSDWYPMKSIMQLGLPTLMKKILGAITIKDDHVLD